MLCLTLGAAKTIDIYSTCLVSNIEVTVCCIFNVGDSTTQAVESSIILLGIQELCYGSLNSCIKVRLLRYSNYDILATVSREYDISSTSKALVLLGSYSECVTLVLDSEPLCVGLGRYDVVEATNSLNLDIL